MNVLGAPWLVLEGLLFLGGGAVLWRLQRRPGGRLQPWTWAVVPVLMALVGGLVVGLREAALPVLLDGVPTSQQVDTAAALRAETAEAAWLVGVLMASWCLGAAWMHGVQRPLPWRWRTALLALALALASGDARLGVSGALIAASAIAPGALGLAAGVLASGSGLLGTDARLLHTLADVAPGPVWVAWVAWGVWWGIAACLIGDPKVRTLRPARRLVIALAGGLLAVELTAWRGSSLATPAPLASEVVPPVLVPPRETRIRTVDLVWAVAEASDIPDRAYALADADMTLAELADEGAGRLRLVVSETAWPLPPGLDRWRYQATTLVVLDEATPFRAGPDALRVRWRHESPVLISHGAAPLTDGFLATALDDAPLRVDLIADPTGSVTLQTWLDWCARAERHHRFVRCAVAAPPR